MKYRLKKTLSFIRKNNLRLWKYIFKNDNKYLFRYLKGYVHIYNIKIKSMFILDYTYFISYFFCIYTAASLSEYKNEVVIICRFYCITFHNFEVLKHTLKAQIVVLERIRIL